MKHFYSHESSFVDPGALIGGGSKIWHFAHICGRAIVGENVIIGQGVYVADRVKIGNRCKIQNNVSVFEGVELEEDVFCGPSMVFTNVNNPRAFVERKEEFRLTLIKRGASLGANCTIVCGVTVGEFAFVAAGAVITKDVKPYAVIAGVPGLQIGWMDRTGNKLPLPPTGNGSFFSETENTTYVLEGDKLWTK